MAKTANEVLDGVTEDHLYEHAPINTNETGGIQRALKMHWDAIKALADKIDGVNKDEPVKVEPVKPTFAPAEPFVSHA